MWQRRGIAPHTYVTDHLRYDVPSGYQHRAAHGGGSNRGFRSKEAYDRRKEAWKSSRLLGRRDFRIWKSEIKDSTMRVHGGANPQPPIHPRPTYVERFRKFQTRLPTQSQTIQSHSTRSATSDVSVPLPTNTDVHVLTWNVEGLRESAKYDAILTFCKLKSVSLLCAQETKAESSYFFIKNGQDYPQTDIMAWVSLFPLNYVFVSPILYHTPPGSLRLRCTLFLIRLLFSMSMPPVW